MGGRACGVQSKGNHQRFHVEGEVWRIHVEEVASAEVSRSLANNLKPTRGGNKMF